LAPGLRAAGCEVRAEAAPHGERRDGGRDHDRHRREGSRRRELQREDAPGQRHGQQRHQARGHHRDQEDRLGDRAPGDQREHPAGDGEGRQHRRGPRRGTGIRRGAGDPVAGQRRGGNRGPGRDRERQHPPGEAGPGPRRAGRQGEEEAGDADGERADDGQVPRVERVGDPGRADRHRDDRRIHGLGDEQPRDPLDVGDDPAPLSQHRRDRRERPVEQHHPGDRAAGLAARAHRDAEIGLFERLHVVDAVAGHRHDVAGRLQRPDRGELLRGPDPAEDVRRRQRAADILLAQRGSVAGRAAGRYPGPPRDRRRRARRVAGQHLDRDALAEQVPHRRGGVLAQLLGQHQQRGRLGPGGRQVSAQRPRRAGEHEHPPARLLVAPYRRGHFGRHGPGDDRRRAEQPGAAAVERRAGPLARRRERDPPPHRPPFGGGVARGEQTPRLVRRVIGGGQRADGLGDLRARPAGDRLGRHQAQAGPGQRAGLVDAQHVRPGQALDRGQLLHQHPAAGQAQRARRERDGGQQHQALRHHRHHAGGRSARGLAQRFVAAEELAGDQQQPGGDHHPGHQAQDLVGAQLQLGADQAEPARLRLQPGGVRVAAHAGRADPPGAGDHEAAGHHGVPGPLGHRVGLPGEQRLVELEPVAVQNGAVDGDLIAAGQLEHVVQHDLLRLDLGDRSVADRPGPRGGQDRQPVQRPLGADLLRHPDAGVDHEHRAEQRVLGRPDDQHHDEQRAEDRVEPGQHVGAEDLADAAARSRRYRVDLPGRDAGPDVRLAQAGRGAR
jgi:hypothetical protein